MTDSSASHDDDFFAFFRRYARSGIHAAAAALLTLFGLLASVADHWAFVAVGAAIYLLPPVYLYATGDDVGSSSAPGTSSAGPGRDGTREADETGQEPHSRDRQTKSTDKPTQSTGHQTEPTDPSADSDTSTEWEWRPTSPPVDADLTDAVATADGTYVAGTGGVLLAHRNEGWEVVREAGVAGNGTDLTAVDATADGAVVWTVGDGGVVGSVEVDTDRVVDRSAPKDLTSTWTDVAVAGAAGEETVYLANGSGEVLRGVRTDGGVQWGEPTKPGSGSSVAGLSFPEPRRGVVCDTAGDLFETGDGDRFERADLDVEGTPTATVAWVADADADIDTDSDTDDLTLTVATDSGSVSRRDGSTWTSDYSDDALFGLDHGDRNDDADGTMVAVGENGAVLVSETQSDWEPGFVPVDATLRGVAVHDDGTVLAVGDDGTAVAPRGSDVGSS